jgi:hypothetical protein
MPKVVLKDVLPCLAHASQFMLNCRYLLNKIPVIFFPRAVTSHLRHVTAHTQKWLIRRQIKLIQRRISCSRTRISCSRIRISPTPSTM